MTEGLSGAGKGESWIKIVGKRTMLIPTIDLVKASIETLSPGDGVDVPALRGTLAERFGSDSTCPVTVRRHLKTLGVPAKKKASTK
jgi:hypothetical protein